MHPEGEVREGREGAFVEHPQSSEGHVLNRRDVPKAEGTARPGARAWAGREKASGAGVGEAGWDAGGTGGGKRWLQGQWAALRVSA